MRTFTMLVVMFLVAACTKQMNAKNRHSPLEICSTPEQYQLNLSDTRLPPTNMEELIYVRYQDNVGPALVYHGLELKSNGQRHTVACLPTPACLGSELCPDRARCCDLGAEQR